MNAVQRIEKTVLALIYACPQFAGKQPLVNDVKKAMLDCYALGMPHGGSERRVRRVKGGVS